jgi:hypothetical protein
MENTRMEDVILKILVNQINYSLVIKLSKLKSRFKRKVANARLR